MKNEGSFGVAGIAHPLLFECDRDGRVVWMSSHARAVLGDAPLRRAIGEYLRAGASFRVWPALVMPETLLFAAQAETPAVEPAPFGDDLLDLYFRLEKAERRLAADVFRTRSGRPSALRQIERERQRLGRELHTGVGQMLAAIRLQLDVIATQMPNPVKAVQEALERIGRLSEEALQQVRGVSRRLYPPEWQRLAIDEALRQLWDATGIPQRYAAELRLEVPPREPAQEIKVMLYRAAQEALSNIARHSAAERVAMTLETSGGAIVLTVHDNGRGFDPEAPGVDGGLGLRSIRDAAAEVGAKFAMETAPGGTTLKISAPFEVE